MSILVGDSKHTLSALYFYDLTNKPSWSQIQNACQALMFYVKVEYSLTPRKQWFRIIVKLEEEMRICFIFYALLMLCSGHCYNSVLGLAATPTRVKIFIPSVHLKLNIQNISFSRLTYYPKESGGI
jgi:hypothetical protein